VLLAPTAMRALVAAGAEKLLLTTAADLGSLHARAVKAPILQRTLGMGHAAAEEAAR
jgi:hypothetical protein